MNSVDFLGKMTVKASLPQIGYVAFILFNIMISKADANGSQQATTVSSSIELPKMSLKEGHECIVFACGQNVGAFNSLGFCWETRAGYSGFSAQLGVRESESSSGKPASNSSPNVPKEVREIHTDMLPHQSLSFQMVIDEYI